MSNNVVPLNSNLSGASRRSWKWSKLRGLQARMTLSYVGVTVVFVLLLGIPVFLLLLLIANSQVYNVDVSVAKRIGIQYAYAASLQANGSTLNPRSTFLPGQPDSLEPPGNSVGGNAPNNFSLKNIRIPYVAERNPAQPPIAVGLLIAPDGRVIASSYPARYPTNTSYSVLLAQQEPLISQALQGVSTTTTDASNTFYIAEAVWGRHEKPIGVLYVQGAIPLIGTSDILSLAYLIPVVGLAFLVITVPIGGLFGLMTTRGLVRRIRSLVAATTDFAGGNYAQRVRITRRDEVGQLELDFNHMADQLVASIARQQELTAQNARLAERNRIARELHDAISQDLFSLRMLSYGLLDAFPAGSELQKHITTLERTAGRLIHEMRALLLELRPAHLQQPGLAEALKDIAAAYSERLGIAVTITMTPVSLQTDAEHALLRIAQEALSNAVRHAHATQITLALAPVEGEVQLTISDNGDGFRYDENQQQHGLGLQLMQERIHELQGTFRLRTMPGEGTEITVRLPQKEKTS